MLAGESGRRLAQLTESVASPLIPTELASYSDDYQITAWDDINPNLDPMEEYTGVAGSIMNL